MTTEEKELLLKDLCARLAYGVICVGITYELDDDGERYIPVEVKDTLSDIHNYKLEFASIRLGLISSCKLEIVKPYLRSMSNMTEEERIEFSKLLAKRYCEEDWEGHISTSYCIEIDNVYTDDSEGIKYPSPFSMKPIDWLNFHHFDYRGLIGKGLAIEVTEENNPYNNK